MLLKKPNVASLAYANVVGRGASGLLGRISISTPSWFCSFWNTKLFHSSFPYSSPGTTTVYANVVSRGASDLLGRASISTPSSVRFGIPSYFTARFHTL